MADPDAFQSLINRADAANKKRVPIFKPVTEASYPKMKQARSFLQTAQVMSKTRPQKYREALKKKWADKSKSQKPDHGGIKSAGAAKWPLRS